MPELSGWKEVKAELRAAHADEITRANALYAEMVDHLGAEIARTGAGIDLRPHNEVLPRTRGTAPLAIRRNVTHTIASYSRQLHVTEEGERRTNWSIEFDRVRPIPDNVRRGVSSVSKRASHSRKADANHTADRIKMKEPSPANRTATFRARVTHDAGGMYNRADVAELLRMSAAAIDEQRKNGQMLGVPYGDDFRFPVAQFKNRAIVPGLCQIIAALGDMNPWGKLQLLVAPLDGFSDKPSSILDLLARDGGADVLTQLTGLARSWVA